MLPVIFNQSRAKNVRFDHSTAGPDFKARQPGFPRNSWLLGRRRDGGDLVSEARFLPGRAG
jgi:hypothetical protein